MPDNAHDRYVTWAMQVPEGVAVPSLNQWGMPVWFPDPDTYFPRNVVAMYAIRNPSDGQALTTAGQLIPAPAGVWFTYTDGSGYGMVADQYFYGGTPDLSGGTQYPPEEVRDIDPEVPQWAQDGTMPPQAAEVDDTDMTEAEIDSAMENGDPVEITAPPTNEEQT